MIGAVTSTIQLKPHLTWIEQVPLAELQSLVDENARKCFIGPDWHGPNSAQTCLQLQTKIHTPQRALLAPLRSFTRRVLKVDYLGAVW